MKTIINTDGVSIYAGEALTLTESGAGNGEWLHKSTTTENSTLIDGVTLPADWSGGHYSYADGVWTRTAAGEAARAAALATGRAATVKQIDEDTDALYAAVIGNRAAEYTVAETEATAYAGAGYTGTVPASVASWATAKGWTAQQAADDINATAAAWRTAQAAIRAARLLHKEQARTAASLADLSNVRAQWVGFVAAIRGQLGL